jgi:hypothetical protein
VKNHTNDCAVTNTGTCTCQPEPKARRHGDWCASWVGKDCTCHVAKRKPVNDDITKQDWNDYFHRFGHVPTRDKLIEWKAVQAQRGQGKAGTSRYIDTEPRKTWLGDTMFTHPPTCGVYKSPEPNWAPYCDCWIRDMQARPQRVTVPMADPGEVPKETVRPGWVQSRAPWWVWSIAGFGAGSISAFASMGRLPW